MSHESRHLSQGSEDPSAVVWDLLLHNAKRLRSRDALSLKHSTDTDALKCILLQLGKLGWGSEGDRLDDVQDQVYRAFDNGEEGTAAIVMHLTDFDVNFTCHPDDDFELPVPGGESTEHFVGKQTILMRAIRDEKLHVVRSLIKVPGIDVCIIDENEQCALWHAISQGNLDILVVLLAHPSIDINKCADGSVPLIRAILECQKDVFRFLLSHPDVRVNAMHDDEKSQDDNGHVLHCAVEAEIEDDEEHLVFEPFYLELLLKHADINLDRDKKMTNTVLRAARRMYHNLAVAMITAHATY